MTAAGAWNPPDPDELINVAVTSAAADDATRASRIAIVHTMVRETANIIGASYDLRNPVVEHVLEQMGQKITYIIESDRRAIMAVIEEGWRNGDSIDSIAKRLVADTRDPLGMSSKRAAMIARTELVGATNGGGLAAARVTGAVARKEWATAPGAKTPRHETYIGLNGQKRNLNQRFTVGIADLDYPGDPAGPASEVIHCRCTLLWPDEDR